MTLSMNSSYVGMPDQGKNVLSLPTPFQILDKHHTAHDSSITGFVS